VVVNIKTSPKIIGTIKLSPLPNTDANNLSLDNIKDAQMDKQGGKANHALQRERAKNPI
jgi:hypothetical protein